MGLHLAHWLRQLLSAELYRDPTAPPAAVMQLQPEVPCSLQTSSGCTWGMGL